jgi:hydroxymethylpyrimidine pyrophosphatase-like HAD family hydrolase
VSRYYRAVAVDYDGTLTERDAPDPEVIAAIRRARGAGRLVVLVTGRILSSLRTSFPDAERTFDAIVLENGCVIWRPGQDRRPVAQPVPPELADVLEARGIPVERGDVLLATPATHDQVVLQEIARLGLEVQLVRNRGALMLLPPGVSKGTGLAEALADLGVSGHSAIAVGDAENDHSLVESCELGVAVANAVPSLQAHADVILGERAGRGVIQLLGGALLRGDVRVQPKRWQVRLGLGDDGAVTVPGSQINLLITGGAESGKSHLAGLVAERLVGMGYRVCVIDPEGDHTGLEMLRGFVVVGGTEPSPSPEALGRLLRLGSLVLDLSLRGAAQRVAETRQLLELLAEHRRRDGIPHWIILDEAHLVPDLAALLELEPGRFAAGVVAVTWRPDRLGAATLAAMDCAVAFPGTDAAGGAALAAAGFVLPREPRAPVRGRIEGVLLDRRSARGFVADARTSMHLRHWHKYQSAELPHHQRFFFRRPDRPTGAVAASMADFHHEIGRAEPEVLRHHARNRDFSRWTDDVIRDHDLAARLRETEDIVGRKWGASPEEGRRLLLQVIESHYRSD